MPSVKHPFLKSTATRALRRHASRDLDKLFSSAKTTPTQNFKACMATVTSGALSSQIASQQPTAISSVPTGPAPSSAHSSNDHAANTAASPPGTFLPIMPMMGQKIAPQPRVDIIQCRTSSTQSEPVPTAPLIATTNPRSTVRERFIDLSDASSVELEEEEEKDGYTVYGEAETV